MSWGGHWHESHGHGGHEWGGNKWWILTAFWDAGNPASQVTNMFSSLVTCLFDSGWGGGHHHDHH